MRNNNKEYVTAKLNSCFIFVYVDFDSIRIFFFQVSETEQRRRQIEMKIFIFSHQTRNDINNIKCSVTRTQSFFLVYVSKQRCFIVMLMRTRFKRKKEEKTIKYYSVVHLFHINVNMCKLLFRLGKILFYIFSSCTSLNIFILYVLVSFHNPLFLFYLFFYIFFFSTVANPLKWGGGEDSIKAIG